LLPENHPVLYVTLHKALKQAVRWRLVPTNVVEGATPPRITKIEIRVLAPEQVKVFFEGIKGHRLEAMFVLAITTGLRQGELFGLRWEGIDTKEGLLYVVRTLSKTNGGVVFDPPKTAKGTRAVGLTQVATEALESHKAHQEEEKGTWYQDHDLVFPNTDGDPEPRGRPP
jgi:integrase